MTDRLSSSLTLRELVLPAPSQDNWATRRPRGVAAFPLTRKAKALLLPVLGLIDSRPNDLFHQILRVGAMDAMSILHCSVRHFRTPSVLLPSGTLMRHIQVKKSWKGGRYVDELFPFKGLSWNRKCCSIRNFLRVRRRWPNQWWLLHACGVRHALSLRWAGREGWLMTEWGDSLGVGPRRLARNFLSSISFPFLGRCLPGCWVGEWL